MPKRIKSLIDRIAEMATQQGGYVSKPEMARALYTASQQAQKALLPAKSQRAVGPGLNRELDVRLNPFLRRTPVQVAGGIFTLPANCRYVDFYDVPNARTVEEISGAAWRYRASDVNCGPTAKYPIVGDLPNQQKRILPANIASLTVQYIGQVPEPLYKENYVDDVPVYDDDNSVDTGWGPEMDDELIVRTLRVLGLEIRDPQLMQVATQLTAEVV